MTYEWGAKYSETLSLNVERRDVSGTPSFLGVARGSTIEGDRISFETRSQEAIGDFSQPRNVVHRYRGRVNGDTIAFTMQPEGGSSQVPATFTARRR